MRLFSGFAFAAAIGAISLAPICERTLSPLHHFISIYVYARHGWLMSAGFCLMGIGGASYSWVLLKTLPPGPLALLLLACTVIWSSATGLLAGFPVDIGTSTSAGRIHGGLANLAFAGGFFIIILDLWVRAGSPPLFPRPCSLLFATASGIGMAKLAQGGHPYSGLFQRLIIYPQLLWFLCKALLLL